MGIGSPGEPGVSGIGIDFGSGRAPEEQTQDKLDKAVEIGAVHSGRLAVAKQIIAILRDVMANKNTPGARPPTREEEIIWGFAEGLVERKGASSFEPKS